MLNATDQTVGWTAEPEGRGTLGLLWSCFATIFLCTWSAIHPDLPALEGSKRKTFVNKLGLMLLGVISPELFSAIAIGSLYPNLPQYNFKHPGSGKPWGLEQYYFLDMGGYVIEHPEDFTPDYASRPVSSTTTRFYVSNENLTELTYRKIIDHPNLDDDDIDDRSKVDVLAKTLSLLQVIYSIVQLIGRAAQKIASTTLELFTLSIVLCAVITYAAWWQKPFDVQRPVVLQSRARTLREHRMIFSNRRSRAIPLY
ncbi:hypothetical protein CC80DRAFT_560836 [Byssothecium circinans]|uniref:Uncharacterized protein n=1 Tax=Byssothecium circinans TaxID=147558 RepID=A0A6A5TZK1_9PLEO|nr:hypothetical protein CC80DRAFT_560836 [Byssothecium circinans]